MKQYITIKVFGEDKEKSWKFDYCGDDNVRKGIIEFAKKLSEKTSNVCLIEEYQPKLTDEELDSFVAKCYDYYKMEGLKYEIFADVNLTFSNESTINIGFDLDTGKHKIISFYDKNFVEYDEQTKNYFETLFNKAIEV